MVGSPNPVLSTTLAVLRPTPGRATSASRGRGTWPSCRSSSCRDIATTFGHDLSLARQPAPTRQHEGVDVKRLGNLADRHTRQLAQVDRGRLELGAVTRSEEHTSELQSLKRNSYAVFCL